MKNKILIHSIAFSPDGVSTAYLYNDIACGLKDSGYDVVVLTTTPHYNLVKEDLKMQPLSPVCWGLFYKSYYRGIPVFHVPQKKFKSTLARVIGFVYWHILSFLIGLSQKNLALILSPSPPLTIGLVSLLIAKLKGAKAIYNVQEIYPDFLINQGKLKAKPIIEVLKWLERLVYNNSDGVTTIDEVFYNTIVPRFINKQKLFVIPNFVDTEIYRPVETLSMLDATQFPDTKALKIMYAGNIGYAQDWEPLLFLADRFRNQSVEFWVIGEGVLKDSLVQQVEAKGLKNIHILPYQQRQNMPYLIAYADLHFIFMNPAMEGDGFPSKVYTIMACQKPLLIVSGENTPLNNFLRQLNCAFLVDSGATNQVAGSLESIIISVLEHPTQLDSLGKAGYSVIKAKYTKEAVIGKYVKLIKELTSI